MSLIEFVKSLFSPPERSSETAKERLRVVLLSDHLSLAPETIAALKSDLFQVISKYVEIDPAHADVTFEHREREVAMLASVPITGVRDYPRPTAPPPYSTPETRAARPSNGITQESDGALSEATVPVPASTLTAEPGDPQPDGDSVEAVAPSPPTETERGDLPAQANVPAEATADAAPPQKPARASHSGPPRRRRRKKSAGTTPVAGNSVPSPSL